MFLRLHNKKTVQRGFGLLIGICFGFLLQKGGVTQYDVIIRQLLLEDFTVLKIMLTAMLTGMAGVYVLRTFGIVQLHLKPGSLGSTAVGGLIFGVGFGLLGYCPGTVVGAAAQGSLDALAGGIVGMLIGTSVFAAMYPRLNEKILQRGYFGDITLPELWNINPLAFVSGLAPVLILLLLNY